MKIFVIDTSVIIKWLNKNNETNTDKADEILEEVKNGQAELITPGLTRYEIGNVLLKGKQLRPNDAYISLGTAYSLPITFVNESEELAKDTYNIAFSFGITYYDASFMSLAKQYKAILVTENKKHQGKSTDIKVKSLAEYSAE